MMYVVSWTENNVEQKVIETTMMVLCALVCGLFVVLCVLLSILDSRRNQPFHENLTRGGLFAIHRRGHF